MWGCGQRDRPSMNPGPRGRREAIVCVLCIKARSFQPANRIKGLIIPRRTAATENGRLFTSHHAGTELPAGPPAGRPPMETGRLAEELLALMAASEPNVCII